MEKNFLITGIEKVLLVEKDKYPDYITVFTHQLTKNELIFNLSGKGTVYFNGKTLCTDANTIRFLPKCSMPFDNIQLVFHIRTIFYKHFLY